MKYLKKNAYLYYDLRVVKPGSENTSSDINAAEAEKKCTIHIHVERLQTLENNNKETNSIPCRLEKEQHRSSSNLDEVEGTIETISNKLTKIDSHMNRTMCSKGVGEFDHYMYIKESRLVKLDEAVQKVTNTIASTLSVKSKI